MTGRSKKPPKAAKQNGSTSARKGGGGSVSDAEVERFARLFQGYHKAYGLYGPPFKLDDKGKLVGKPRTLAGEPGLDLYRAHLTGKGPGLGIIPLLEGDRVLFGAIDYDNRKMNHSAAESAIRAHNLPLVLCRSKSGGGHFYVFMRESVEAVALQERMSSWRAELGMSAKTELFPKQTSRFNDNDVGNWINLPYYGGMEGERYAILNGEPVTLEEFLDEAESRLLDPAKVLAEYLDDDEGDDETDLFYQGPPCLQTIYKQGGFVEGTRNNGMMAVATYLRKRFPDDWSDRMDKYNEEMAGLPSKELVELVKHNSKKEYHYKCKESPLVEHCQAKKCRKRLFGVGEGPPESRGIDIGAVTRYDSAQGDDPMWRMDVNGKPVMVTNAQFYSRDEFNRACMAQANIVPIRMPPARWLEYLNGIIQTATIVQLPAEAGPSGQLWERVEDFCLQKVHAVEIDEVFLGKPWINDGRIYFRGQDLMKFLDARKVRYETPQRLYMLLREHDGYSKGQHIKGKFVNLWSLPLPVNPVDETVPQANVDPDEAF